MDKEKNENNGSDTKDNEIDDNHNNEIDNNKVKNDLQNDNNNEVLVEDVKGNLVKSFKVDFPSYGQVMTTDLKNYIAADEDFNVYRYDNGQKTQMMESICNINTHTIVNATPRKNYFRLIANGLRLVSQIIWVHPDTMTTNKSRPKRQKIPFCFCCL